MAQRSDYMYDPTCRLCGRPYAGHPRCQCCRILCGLGHFQEAIPYRGKRLCSLCIEAWKRLEADVGAPISWAMLLKGDSFYQGDGTILRAGRR